jgi:hypothetical protein
MTQASARVTFRRWLAVCLLIVWPLNVYYHTQETHPRGAHSFWVHGAPLGAIVAFILGVRNVRRACRHGQTAGFAARPSLGRVVWQHGWWCLGLLPLLVQFRRSSSWNRIDPSLAGAAATYTETTEWGWGGAWSAVFAFAAAFALLATLWRQACEGHAPDVPQ